jgi:high affinity sulfate transporter 1
MFGKIKLTIPLAEVFASYKNKYLRPDILAGLTVAGIAIPQSMAYAQLAGLNLTAGLYAAFFAMLLFAILTSSKYVIMGPDAAMAALAGSAIIPLANGDEAKAAALVAILAIFIGIFSVIAVFARLGYIAEFLSRPILLGYMAGLAILIIVTQLPSVFGIPAPVDTNFIGSVWYLLTSLDSIDLLTFTIGVIALVTGLFITKNYKRFPAGLVLLVISIGISVAFQLSDKGVQVVGSIPVGLPIPSLPSVELFDLQNLLIPALAMMLVAYANTVSTARSFASKEHKSVDSDQEFFGLGMSNVGSGLFGGMPVSASSSRTSVNYTSGAKTQLAQIFGAIAIGLLLLLFSGALQYLPISVLAVIIIIAVLPLFNFKELNSIWHAWRSEAVLAIITAVGVATLGIYQGLLLAVLLAIANVFRKSAFPYDAVLGVAKDGSVHDMKRPPKTVEVPGLKIYRFDAPLYFANATYFRRRVHELIDESDTPVKWFLWDAETVTHVDSTSGMMLLDLINELKQQDVVFAVARMKGSIRTIVHHSHRLNSSLQHSPHYASIGDAIEAYRQENNVPRTYDV